MNTLKRIIDSNPLAAKCIKEGFDQAAEEYGEMEGYKDFSMSVDPYGEWKEYIFKDSELRKPIRSDLENFRIKDFFRLQKKFSDKKKFSDEISICCIDPKVPICSSDSFLGMFFFDKDWYCSRVKSDLKGLLESDEFLNALGETELLPYIYLSIQPNEAYINSISLSFCLYGSMFFKGRYFLLKIIDSFGRTFYPDYFLNQFRRADLVKWLEMYSFLTETDYTQDIFQNHLPIAAENEFESQYQIDELKERIRIFFK